MNNLYLQTEPKLFCVLMLIGLSVFRMKYFRHQLRESKFLYLVSSAEVIILIFAELIQHAMVQVLCFLVCGFFSIFAMYLGCVYAFKVAKNNPKMITKMVILCISILFGVFSFYVSDTAVFVLTFMILALFITEQYNKIRMDNLTKLYNRYGMDVELREQLREYEKEHSDSFYIISCDLDNFKHINDTWGHLEGDRALVLIAGVLTKVGKKFSSEVFRIGGDEFIIIADTKKEGIDTDITNAIKAELNQIKFRDDFDIQMSIGVALYDGKSTIDELLNHADKKMYEAKRSSR